MVERVLSEIDSCGGEVAWKASAGSGNYFHTFQAAVCFPFTATDDVTSDPVNAWTRSQYTTASCSLTLLNMALMHIYLRRFLPDEISIDGVAYNAGSRKKQTAEILSTRKTVLNVEQRN